MANSKHKPVIPEPSPRFCVWSMIVGLLMIAAITAYMAWTGRGEPVPAAKLNGQKAQRQSSLSSHTVFFHSSFNEPV
jgi:hypothetical protein